MSKRNDSRSHNEWHRKEFERFSNPDGIEPPTEDEYRDAIETLCLVVGDDWRGPRGEDITINADTFYTSSPKYVQRFDIGGGTASKRVLAQLVRNGVVKPSIRSYEKADEDVYEYCEFIVDVSKVPEQTDDEAWERARFYIDNRLYGLDFNNSPLHELKYGAGIFRHEVRERMLQRLYDEGLAERPQPKTAKKPRKIKERNNDMALTITEANAVNTLLRFFLGKHPSDRYSEQVTLVGAKAAAGVLSAGAYKTLSAGISQERSDDLFDSMVSVVNRHIAPATDAAAVAVDEQPPITTASSNKAAKVEVAVLKPKKSKGKEGYAPGAKVKVTGGTYKGKIGSIVSRHSNGSYFVRIQKRTEQVRATWLVAA